MYLSRLKLDLQKRKAVIAMENPNIIHGILRAGQPEEERVLWRLDKFQGSYYIYFVSQDPLHSKLLISELAESENDFISKNYDSALRNVKEGSVFHFRLTAVPTWSAMIHEHGVRGKKLSCHSNQKREEWLERIAKLNGFCVNSGEFAIKNVKMIQFTKRGSKRSVEFQSVTYEGLLTVTDPEPFVKALTTGIGREKAYGQGLLTIAGV